MHKSTRGITLMELIVSTFVVGIVMAGIVSAEFALRKYYGTISQVNNASFNARTMIEHIMNSAYQMVGSYPTDPGYKIGPDIGSTPEEKASFCIRTVKAPDSWTCYTQIESGSPTVKNLYTCVQSTPVPCTSSSVNLGYLATTGSMWVDNNGSKLQASFVGDSSLGSQTILFTAEITAIDSSSSTGPSVTFSSSITPPNYKFE